ncbi:MULTISPECIES: helix-turn-helix transcriptional regulator [unclassified Mycolicibacterium]|uniref:helix-turn-helix transcriptional regulator n=1 Tax=unclassified Mycolicibacterium TaxID=2636767 RepID=UPI0012DEB75B|nr:MULTISPECIES: helix-turn-helix transcriptional regulator [unclassified Mycolicibacterium]MUL82194.1 helix-turn-helix transcriptional regulator [Mycolicibacterium sp. CBMA 329]MUL87960.1 helix-turn-helix transcriptional regulator [Mycolicibacterium sp. CBMA 331]MUM02291.1 helix-turn-helix transcriptional regulator [Mycolicibacterium sp. CBMA 334]MUM26425.1 helix-turn-helix transcriptional regulator [Mycolicibacterium sp. CBMA 295]MUM38257.1 helix-turn-helix transcriptional regulator [Mycolic
MRRITAGLQVEDYEKVFAVLDACDDTADFTEFRQAVVGAVRDVFEVRGVTFFTGPTVAGAFADTDPVTTDTEHVLLGDYMSRWRGHDVFATPIALKQLHTAGSVSLRELTVPASAAPYVEQFLHRAGMQSCNAFTFPMGSAAHGLLGVFDPDPDAVSARDASALRLLCRRLRGLSRPLMPTAVRLDPLAQLPKRQRDVAELLAHGRTNAQIAETLCLTEDTVKKYVSRALATTGCRSRTELAVLAAAS